VLEETNASGAAQADYIYLDGRPVAVLNGSTLYYLAGGAGPNEFSKPSGGCPRSLAFGDRGESAGFRYRTLAG
jgi:hypothetical protein